MIRGLILASVVAATGLATAPSYAHHSYAMFDQEKEVTLEGTVIRFDFVNPHSWLHVSVPDRAGGEAKAWALELGSPAQMARRGWKRNSVSPGDKVVVKIHPLKDGTTGGSLRSVVTSDGRPIPG